MSERLRIVVLWVAAAILLAAGVALSLATRRDIREAREGIEKTREHLRTLVAWQRELAAYEQSQACFAALEASSPKPLAELARSTLADIRLEEVREASREVAGGWVLREKEISLAEAPLTNVMAFIQLAETQRPPWRLEQLRISASARAAGVARVALRFRTLAKAEPAGTAR